MSVSSRGLCIPDLASFELLRNVKVWVPRDSMTGELIDIERHPAWDTQGPIEQWALALSDMREPKWEHSTKLFAIAKTSRQLVELLQREAVAPYSHVGELIRGEGPFMYLDPRTWNKAFRQGGPLEWANPVAADDEDEIRPSLTLEQLLRREERNVRERYARMMRDALDLTGG